jgi:hypothetical protein
VRFAEALPKTRSGKIMRRLLKQVASGLEIKGDTTTLEDLSVLLWLHSLCHHSGRHVRLLGCLLHLPNLEFSLVLRHQYLQLP